MTLIFILGSTSHIYGQQKTLQHSGQQWIQYYNQLKLNSRWMLLSDGGFRWRDHFTERSLYIVRIGATFSFGDLLRVGGGLATTGSYSAAGLNRVEIRPYQEMLLSTVFAKVGIQHRLRIEERFFKEVVGGDITQNHNFNFRFRYQMLATVPLIKIWIDKREHQLALSVSDEIFLNAGKEIVYNYLDKNRFVIGPTLQVNKNVNIGLLYNYEFSQLNAPASYTHTDVIWLTLRHQMSLSKI